MKLFRFFAISGLIAPFAVPASVAAQARTGAQVFTSIDNSFPGGAGVAGFGLTLASGGVGVRGSFGMGLSNFSSQSGTTSTAAPTRWSGDADFIFGGSHLGGAIAEALVPYAFAGIGAHSKSASPSFNDAAKTWSYGGGLTLPVASTVGISGEVRYRNQLGSANVATADFVAGTEYRIGISIHFGSSSRSAVYSNRGSASSPPRPTSGGTRSGTRTTWPASSTNAAAAARRVVPDAEQYIGVPYVYGGSTPSGFDCSGFVQYVYARQGIDLPRTSRQMAGSGTAVSPTPGAMATGDLMLFTQGGRISHVAIYAGSGRFIHSSSSGGGVRYDDLNTQRGKWFADHLVAVRRVAGEGRSIRSAFTNTVIAFDHFDPPDSAPPVRKR